MRLEQMSAEDTIAELEKRQDRAIAATDSVNRIEAAHKAMESLTYKARRSAGDSIEDAKRAIHTDENIKNSLGNLFDAQKEQALAKAAVERAKYGIDLWRSVRADRRMV